MKKELPKIFKNYQNKSFTNNINQFYGHCQNRKEKNTVDYLFEINKIYRNQTEKREKQQY